MPPVASGQIIVEAALNQRPAAFLNAATNKVYVGYTGGGSGMIAVIDAATDSIAQTATIPGGIETMQFNPGTNKIYIVQESAATTTQILVYDLNTLTQVAAIGGIDNAPFSGPRWQSIL